MNNKDRRLEACRLCGDWFDPGEDRMRTQCPRCEHREGDPDEEKLDFCKECGRDDHSTEEHPLICPHCGQRHPYEECVVGAIPYCDNCGGDHWREDCPEIKRAEDRKAARDARGFVDPLYKAERPENWEEMSPSGREWGAGLSLRRSRSSRLTPLWSKGTKDGEWKHWEKEWDEWPCWMECPDCGFGVPMQAGGNAGPGWAGQCSQCGRSVWVDLGSPEVKNNQQVVEE